MTHEAAQPTLDRAPGLTPADILRPLNLIESAALRAFHRAPTDRGPIAPCFSMTRVLALLLTTRGVLKPCTDGESIESKTIWRALYDPLRWWYLGDWTPTPELEIALRFQIQALSHREDAIGHRAIVAAPVPTLSLAMIVLLAGMLAGMNCCLRWREYSRCCRLPMKTGAQPFGCFDRPDGLRAIDRRIVFARIRKRWCSQHSWTFMAMMSGKNGDRYSVQLRFR